jgi:hypothetical protein
LEDEISDLEDEISDLKEQLEDCDDPVWILEKIKKLNKHIIYEKNKRSKTI